MRKKQKKLEELKVERGEKKFVKESCFFLRSWLKERSRKVLTC